MMEVNLNFFNNIINDEKIIFKYMDILTTEVIPGHDSDAHFYLKNVSELLRLWQLKNTSDGIDSKIDSIIYKATSVVYGHDTDLENAIRLCLEENSLDKMYYSVLKDFLKEYKKK